MISDKFQCIFIHIPKNAGTSIESRICSEEGTVNLLPDHRTILDLEPLYLHKLFRLYKKDQMYSAARRIKNFLTAHEMGNFYRPTSALRYRNYFKFTVIRNPWSRVYSWYRNVMNDINHRKRYKVLDNCTFDDFVKHHIDNHHALRTQFYWIRDSKGNIPMDFVANFENLASDFSKIAQAIGLSDSVLPKKRYTGKSDLYKEAYNSVTKDIVWKKYKNEIDHFGFKFDE